VTGLERHPFANSPLDRDGLALPKGDELVVTEGISNLPGAGIEEP
jgi:hypothetical protein